MAIFDLKFNLCFLIVFSFFLSSMNCVQGAPQVPCYFIFGDSYSDNGNNNNLITVAKSNFRPYGIDFPKGPTGRFSNGQNMVDVIAQSLGFEEPIPPFASSPSNEDILKGVNYASGSSGIRNETGKIAGVILSLDRQLTNHKSIIWRLAMIMGNNASATNLYLRRCLFSVAIGTNDYILNYFLPIGSTTRPKYTPEQYAAILVEELSQQLKTLYDDGARKIALFGLLPLGCLPFVRNYMNIQNRFQCAENVNIAVQLFNQRLKSMVDDFNTNFTDSKFIYINTYGIGLDILSSQSFRVNNSACCQVTPVGMCVPFGLSCPNRTQYVFWDRIHLTEASYRIIGERAYKSQSPSDSYPFDISRLAQLN